MKRTFFVAAVALASVSITAPSFAQETGPSTDPALLEAGSYAVETAHTRVMFGVSHFGFNDYFGEFTGATGTLVLDTQNPAASKLDVTVPTANIHTSNAKLDGELKSADWFDAAKYPTITFKSTSITVTGPGKADVAGDLTMHGVTKPIVLSAIFNAAGPNPMSKVYTSGFHVSGNIKRSDFGINTYLPAIGDEVKLMISAAFEKSQ